MPDTELLLQLRRYSGDDSEATYTLEATITQPGGVAPIRVISGSATRVSLISAELLALSNSPEAYGAALAARLFGDARVREVLVAARAYAAAQGALRLRLDLDAADPAAHELRWEMLCDPTGAFLATSERVLLSRYLPGAEPFLRPAPPRQGIRALLVVSAPNDLPRYQMAPINAAAEVERASRALGPLLHATLAQGAGAPPATRGNLRSALLDGPEIVLIIAHGATVGGRTYLWLERPDGTSDPCPADELTYDVQQHERRPLLMLLLICQSAGRSHHAGALTSLGPQLVAAGVPAVIAMQDNLSQETAALLLPRLISELRRDGRIDRALAAARSVVRDRPDWWCPALFLGIPDGRLWAPPAEQPARQPAGDVPLRELRSTLSQCDEFGSQRQLRALFGVERLALWRNSLPEADSLIARVDLTIDYLRDRRRADGHSAMLLLLDELIARRDPVDGQHAALSALRVTLEPGRS